MKTLFIFIIINGSFLYCCQHHNSLPEKFILSEDISDQLKDKIQENNAILYYHSGDCSICYLTLMRISEEFPEIPLVSLTSFENKGLVEYQLEQIGFKGFSLYDTSGVFTERNHDLLQNGNIFLIDSKYNILCSGMNISEKILKEIRHQHESRWKL